MFNSLSVTMTLAGARVPGQQLCCSSYKYPDSHVLALLVQDCVRASGFVGHAWRQQKETGLAVR